MNQPRTAAGRALLDAAREAHDRQWRCEDKCHELRRDLRRRVLAIEKQARRAALAVEAVRPETPASLAALIRRVERHVDFECGPSVTIVNAFLLIGLDLTTRDALHERWKDDQLALRMGALVFAGGAISFVVNRDAAAIAVASSVAFTVSALLDAFVFDRLSRQTKRVLGGDGWWGNEPRWSRLERINGSNIAGAAADSLLFPTLAFGGFLPVIVLGQFAAKVAGGFLWSLVLAVPLRRRSA